MNQQEFILVHIMLGFSTILPAFLMSFLDTERNGLVGYRTIWSVKNDHTWKFAQEYSAKAMRYASAISIVIQIICIFLFEGETSILITAGALTFCLLMSIFFTERALRMNFNKDGTPKSQEETDLF